MFISLSDILTVLRKIVDISLVWLIFYFILKNIKNNVKLSLIFKGLLIIIILNCLALLLLDIYWIILFNGDLLR